MTKTSRGTGFVLGLMIALLSACVSDGSGISGATGGTTTGGAAGTAGKGGASAGSGGVASGGAPAGTGGVASGGAGGGPSSGGSAASGGAAGGGGRPGTGGQSGSGGSHTGGSKVDGGAGNGGSTGGSGGSTGGSGGSTGGSGGSTGGSGGSTGGTGGSGGSTGGSGGSGGSSAGAGGSTLPPITDYGAQGPFKVTTEKNVGPGNAYTVFRPSTLGANGFLHAPIIFGPGIGMQVSSMAGLLTTFASHGFVVVGCNVLNGGPNDVGNRTAMLNGLNWIVQQNSQPGTYQGKLDVTHAVSMGYSVGGTAAVEVGGHESVATVVSIHGHTATANLHGTMLQTSGTADTVGLPMQQKTFNQSQVQTFLGTVSGADHGYIQRDNGGVERPAIVAWLRYWIYGDTGGKRYFYGDDCVMCTAPWTNPQRKNWK